jgi:hypothetical protein
MITTKRITTNGVKGTRHGFNRGTSPGTDSHDRQVTPDRQPDTVEKRRKGDLHLATWNVRTLYQAGKLENVKQEMKRLKINILGMSETRWSDSGLVNTDSMKFIYSGEDKHER